LNTKRSTEQFNITIPPAMAQRVRASIEAGAYASQSDVFRDALRRMWDNREAVPAAALVKPSAP
jgi:antitoxin ParD1/3/4